MSLLEKVASPLGADIALSQKLSEIPNFYALQIELVLCWISPHRVYIRFSVPSEVVDSSYISTRDLEFAHCYFQKLYLVKLLLRLIKLQTS